MVVTAIPEDAETDERQCDIPVLVLVLLLLVLLLLPACVL
jgi:hypothetical protein